MPKGSKIPVLNPDNRLLSFTNPAKARIMIRERRAHVFSKNPYIIKMVNGEETEIAMQRKIDSIISFQKFFEDERDIYVQNTSNTQISLTFYEEGGRVNPVTIGVDTKKRPMNLTQYVSFEALKKSMDLRAIANREPPVLRMLTEEEFLEFFENLAKRNKTDINAEMGEAAQFHSRVMNKQPSKKEEERKKKSAKEIIEERRSEEEEIVTTVPDQPHPRVAMILSQVDEDLDKSERMSASQILDELKAIEDDLNEISISLLLKEVKYKTVKKYLMGLLDNLSD